MLKLTNIHSRIWEDELDKIVLQEIKEITNKVISKNDIEARIDYFYQATVEKEENKLNYRRNQYNTLVPDLQKLYEAYVRGELTLEFYQEKKSQIQKQMASLKEEMKIHLKRIQDLKTRKKDLEQFINALPIIYKRKTIELDTKMLQLFIDFIEIGKGKEVVIHYKFNLENEISKEIGEAEYE